MGYMKAEDCLPIEVIELIQQYVEGKSIYIPKKEDNRLDWGAMTGSKQRLVKRDNEIFNDYLAGEKVADLALKYFLSEKSIQRIIRKMKREKSEINP